MIYDYLLLDPSKNITALVTSPAAPEMRCKVAAAVMAQEPECEQVGFVSASDSADIRLDMAGGEFCGNAAMSAAVLAGVNTGKNALSVSVSGCPEPVNVRLRKDGEAYIGTVTMPKAQSVGYETLDGESFPTVRLPGITHIIISNAFALSDAESRVRRWCAELKSEALGLMLLDGDKLTPLVYVPSADTLFWESSCASGTAAAGIFLAEAEGKPISRRFTEPGSTLSVQASPGTAPELTGKVEIIKKASVEA